MVLAAYWMHRSGRSASLSRTAAVRSPSSVEPPTTCVRLLCAECPFPTSETKLSLLALPTPRILRRAKLFRPRPGQLTTTMDNFMSAANSLSDLGDVDLDSEEVRFLIVAPCSLGGRLCGGAADGRDSFLGGANLCGFVVNTFRGPTDDFFFSFRRTDPRLARAQCLASAMALPHVAFVVGLPAWPWLSFFAAVSLCDLTVRFALPTWLGVQMLEMLAAMGQEDPEMMEQMMAELMKDPAFAEVGTKEEKRREEKFHRHDDELRCFTGSRRA